MARFLRSYGKTNLRPPAVVNTPVVFAPVRVTLTDQRVNRLRHASFRSRLAPPEYVAALDPFRANQIKLADQRPLQRRRIVHSNLKPPTVLGAVVVAPQLVPIQTKLANQRALRIEHGTHSLIKQAAVINTPVVYAPNQVKLADQQHGKLARRQVRSINPKVVFDPVVVPAFVPVPVKVEFADQRTSFARRRFSHSRLQLPTVVGAVVVQPIPPPIKVVLASQLATLKGHRSFYSRLRLAEYVAGNDPFGAAQIKLADQRSLQRRRIVHSRLQSPTIIGAAGVVFTPDPIKVKLARQRLLRTTHSHLQAPTAVGAATVTFVPDPNKVRLADQRALRLRRNIHFFLSRPAVVANNDPFRPTTVGLTDQRPSLERRRIVHSRLQPPSTLTPAVVVFIAAPEKVVLADQRAIQLRRREIKSVLRPPQVVSNAIIYAPVSLRLADQRSVLERSRVTHSKKILRPIEGAAVVSSYVPRLTLLGVG